MKTLSGPRLGAVFGVVALSALSTSLQAETTQCTVINTIPYVINTQGVYCFKQHLATDITSGNAITINTNNVVIDMNGFKLGGLIAGPTTEAVGIYGFDRQNITIRNGSIRGFIRGIFLAGTSPYDDSQGHLIEGVRADGNTRVGIAVEGRGSVIRGNQVVQTGGTTHFSDVAGILVRGTGVEMIDNSISETVEESGELSYGVLATSANGAVIEGNRVSNTDLGAGTSYGVQVTSSDGVSVVNNRLSNVDTGVRFTSSTGKYRDNLTNGVTTPFSGGTDAGGND